MSFSLTKTLIDKNELFVEFKGSLTENHVAQELFVSNQRELFYWASPGVMEIDFLVEVAQNIYPLQLKAEISSKKKSLLQYKRKYPQSTLSRSTPCELKT